VNRLGAMTESDLKNCSATPVPDIAEHVVAFEPNPEEAPIAQGLIVDPARTLPVLNVVNPDRLCVGGCG
jgi:hypothetical protein